MVKIVVPVVGWAPLVALLLAWVFSRRGKSRGAKFCTIFFLTNFIIFAVGLLIEGDMFGVGTLLTLFFFLGFLISLLIWQSKK